MDLLAQLGAHLLVLAVVVYALKLIVTGRAGRTASGGGGHDDQADAPRWLASLAWIPTGWALAVAVGPGLGVLATIFLAGSVALCHRVAPGPVDVVVGGAGLLAALGEATRGTWCTEALGVDGFVVLVALALVAVVFGLTSMISFSAVRRIGTLLVAAVALVNLSRFATVHVGGVLVVSGLNRWAAAALIGVVVLSFAIGAKPSFALAVLGAALVVGDLAIVVGSGVCLPEFASPLLTAVVFATTRRLLTSTRPFVRSAR